jgi:S1-C subfamily serine protease
LAALVAVTPFGRLATGLQRSLILRTLNVVAPPSPSIVTNIKAFINPNGFPRVFVGIEPWPSQPVSVADQAAIDSSLARYGASVVHVEGFGCGGLSGGSGFVVAPGVIMTNAHVVAGIKRPFAVDRAGVHLATPVLFDSRTDIALLRVSNLYGSPLAIADATAKPGAKAVVLGYPEGGPLKGDPAGVMDERTITGLDIYGRETVQRPSYILQSPIRPGGSGSPVVQDDGSVIGMVFARSLLSDQIGFALTSPVLLPALSHASSLTDQVGTGTCEP